ncbi:MAG TPA: hypothetical protein VK402_17760 [Blastococcus sp.]|nr:hypothetical protein [Blastococcus sp.]
MGASPPNRRRPVTFRVVATITVLLFVLALPNVLAAWWPVSMDPAIRHPDAARWHTVVEGTGDAAGVVLLLALIRRPAANPLVPLSFALSAVVACLMVLPFTGPSLLFAVLPVVAVLAAYPYWDGVRILLRSGIRWSRPLLALALGAAALLALPIVDAVSAQLGGVGEMAATNQWATYAEHLTSLVLGAVLAATRLPGWRLVAAVQGLAWSYLGIAAVVLPGHPDSWGAAGGAVAVAAGVTSLGVALRDRPVRIGAARTAAAAA